MNSNPEADITLRFLAEPSDVNFGGNVHGGNVMKWIDHAGYTCAANWSSAYCVTVYVGGIRFLKPWSDAEHFQHACDRLEPAGKGGGRHLDRLGEAVVKVRQ